MTSLLTLDARKDFTARCTRCSQCKFVPSPASQRHASACPSIDHGEHHAFSGGGQVIMAHGLIEGVLSPTPAMLEAVGSCTLCGACDVSCKVNFAETVEPLQSLYALRAKLVEIGAAPAAYGAIVDRLVATGNPHGHPRADRARWADGLGLRAAADRDDAVLLHVGSTLSYAVERAPALRAIVATLAEAGFALCHAAAAEGPTGATAWDLGHVDAARCFARDTVDSALQSGAGTLVTFSAAAIAAFRAIYPRLGLHFGAMRVLHITEFLEEQVAAGRLTIATAGDGVTDGPLTYHDPCRLGRLSEPWTSTDPQLDKRMSGILCSREPEALRFGNGGCYDAPRALLRRMGIDLVEMERHGPASYCCGAAGGVPQAQPEAAARAARTRLDEARDSGAVAMVSGCSGCAGHIDGNGGGALPVLDLLDLVSRTVKAA